MVVVVVGCVDVGEVCAVSVSWGGGVGARLGNGSGGGGAWSQCMGMRQGSQSRGAFFGDTNGEGTCANIHGKRTSIFDCLALNSGWPEGGAELEFD